VSSYAPLVQKYKYAELKQPTFEKKVSTRGQPEPTPTVSLGKTD